MRLLLRLLVLGLFVGATGSAQAAGKSLVLCYEDTSNPPFYYGSRDTKPGKPGVTVEVIEAAAKRNGLELKLLQIPWKRCLSAMKNNLVDGAFDFSYKAKREEFAVYPYTKGTVDKKRYLHELAYYLYTLDDSDVEWDGEKLKNLTGKLAAVSGYSIVGDLRADGYSVEEGLNQRSNLEMLVRGRVEGLAQFATITNAVIESRPKRYANVKRHELPLRSKLYYLVFAKEFYTQNTELAEKIWNSLAEVNGDGTAKKISAKYTD